MSETRDFSTQRRRARATPLDQGLLLVSAVLLVAVAWAAGSLWVDLRQVTAATDEVRRETTDAEARLKALSGRPGPTESLAAQAVASAAAPPPRVVAELAALLPTDVRIDHLALRYGAHIGLEMQVTARTSAAYDVFLERLELSPAFSDVAPGDEDRTSGTRASIGVSYRGDLR